MKLRRIWVAMLAMLCMLPTIAVQAAASTNEIHMVLNGHSIASEVPPFITMKTYVTMVPLRVISESLGAQVNWKDQTVTINQQNNVLMLQANQKNATVNGEDVEIQEPATIRGSRVLVPLRFVAENLGVRVSWDGASQTITMTSAQGNTQPATDAQQVQQTQEPQSAQAAHNSQSAQEVQPTQTAQDVQHTQGTYATAEMRGAWISVVSNLDWPSKAGLTPFQQKLEFTKQLDDLKRTGITDVFVQVRVASDAIYPSKLVPWSRFLTGVQGGDPGYDPLAFMIEEAHARGLKFHAWFNPYRVSTDSKLDKLAANNPAVLHPEWVVKHQGKYMFDPGIPDAREHIIEAIMEVVHNYNIDGVHLDDYFYPYGQNVEPFNDQATYAKYNQGKFSNIGDWRRDNVNQFVQELGGEIHQVKPQVDFGISPFGVWRNAKTDPSGSNTNALSSYDDLYADTRTWIQQHWIDYIAPQVYWSDQTAAAPYKTVVDWWVRETQGTKVKLYIGLAPYKVGTAEAGWGSTDTIINQLDYNKQTGQVAGELFFRAKSLQQNTLGLSDRIQAFYNSNSTDK